MCIICYFSAVADMMIAINYYNFLKIALKRHPDVYDFYSTLASLIERNPTLAMKHGWFEFLVYTHFFSQNTFFFM